MFRKKDHAEPPTEAVKGPRAPLVAAKLEAALDALATLETEVGELALEAIERKAGAAEKLTARRGEIDAAKRAVEELRAAVKRAERLDREADAAAAVTMRAEQLAVFERAAAERVDAMAETINLIAKAAKTWARYAAASAELAAAVPSGTRLPVMTYGTDGAGGAFLGDGAALLGREAWRVAAAAGSPIPPFGKAPSASDDHRAATPALEMLSAAHTAVLIEIRGQVERLDNEALAIAARGEAA